ncbi:acyl carrier protein [Pseudomonas sp. LP_7_YM]|uniref:acyl carrier protein n=1 Tax=Pseudomonas sp. LP_7_YM TaxID=2485137 RepID=UPI001061415C|nr:acyl carrier protein [Pseudomonas sp. LP_7_YM]TDV68033.1 acyl carrier protein [Pseudomonas sp. LP_7_YM]
MEEKIVSLIEESMEVDAGTLSLDQPLDWDSIALITFMATAEEHLSKSLSAARLNKCITVRDVVTLACE